METTSVTAEQATEIALKFVKKHRAYARLLKAAKEKEVWRVTIDVGVWTAKIAQVNIDARNGQILDYSIPG
jgi:uncharacterized membrane protein YkoI